MSPAPPWRINAGLKVGDVGLFAMMLDIIILDIRGMWMEATSYIPGNSYLRMDAASWLGAINSWIRRGALGMTCQRAMLYISGQAKVLCSYMEVIMTAPDRQE